MGTVPDTRDDGRRKDIAWFCQHLAGLALQAEANGWSAQLDRCVSELRQGTDPGAALRALGLDPDGTGHVSRGQSAGSRALWDEVTTVGEYRCPHDALVCLRRASRDEEGRPPVCSLDGRPMVPATDRAARDDE